MNDKDKTKEQLIEELIELRRRFAKNEKSDAGLIEAEKRISSMMQTATDSIICINNMENIILWNHKAVTMFGYSANEIIGKPITKIIPERFREAHKNGSKKFLDTGKSKIIGKNHEITALRKDGSEFPIEISVGQWEEKGVPYFIGIVRDITERKKMKEKLQAAAITDELTGLFNRRGFFTISKQHFKLADRTKRKMALLYLDIDNMKAINDELGHHAGDQALMDTANILKNSFRESDIIARIGGDEFAVLIMEHTEPNIENIIINHVQDNLRIHNEQDLRNYELSFSMGVVHYNPKHPYSIDNLLTQADELMYKDKKYHKFEEWAIPSIKDKGRERRAYKRFKTGNNFRAKLDGSNKVKIKDIGIGGICLITSQLLTANIIHNVNIFPPENEKIALKSIVVWSYLIGTETKKNKSLPYYESGLKFVEMNDSLKNSLEKFISGLVKR